MKRPWWLCRPATRRRRRWWRERMPHHVCGVAHVSDRCPPPDQWVPVDQAMELFALQYPNVSYPGHK